MMCPESKSKTAAVPIKTFVFIDLESTGLPFLQRKIKMTEFSAIAVRRKSLLETQSTTDCIPRITNKISFVVNPVALIPDDVVQLTGIDNFMVEEMRPFDQNAAKILKNFLKTCDEPICLVAHNGYRFDFPLLKEELKNFPQIIPDNTLCIDSLEAFKIFAKVSQENGTPSPLITHTDVLLFETAVEAERTVSLSEDEILMAEAMKIEVNLQQKNETTPEAQIIGRTTFNENVNKAKRKLFPNTPSPVTTKLKVNYSLPFIFETLFHEPIDRKHQAEGDAMALLRCIVKLGSPVLEYFDLHAKYFVDIKSLY